MLDKNTRQRIYLPVITECILENVDCIVFESSMSSQSHKTFNTLLNSEVEKGRWRYSHTYTTDSFINTDASQTKMRITRDQRSGNVVEAVKKTKLWNLNLHIPQSQFDVRFTLNIETAVPISNVRSDVISESPFQRHKDRISYINENMGVKVDLTQVSGLQDSKKAHELEIEIMGDLETLRPKLFNIPQILEVVQRLQS